MDQESRIAAMDERVLYQGRAINDLSNQLTAAVGELKSQLTAVAATVNASQKVQWPAITVALVFAGMVGALAYWPIRENQAEMKDAIIALAKDTVPRASYEQNRNLFREDYRADMLGFTTKIDDLSARLMPLREADIRLTDIQRQIDELKRVRPTSMVP